MCGDIDQTDPGDGVVSHRDGQRDEQHYERYGLFAHPEDGSEKGEEEHYERHYYIVHAYAAQPPVAFEAFRPLQKVPDACLQGVGSVHYPECASYYQYEYYDGGLAGESAQECGEDLPGLRLRRYLPECYGSPVIRADVFPSGDEPGGCGADEDNGEDYQVGIGEAAIHIHRI